MAIGIPREIKTDERRVALVPEDCKKITSAGVTVNIEASAGLLSGFSDSEYIAAGCLIKNNARMLYEESELIVKVKEPQKNEIALFHENHSLFCFLHLGGNAEIAENLRNTGITAYAFETVMENNQTPLLAPMSIIAGHLSVIMSSHFIMTPYGGRGIMLGKNSLHDSGKMLIIGMGMAGTSALEIAGNMGIDVYAADISHERLSNIKNKYPQVNVIESSADNFKKILPEIDVVIGAIYVLGKKAPVVLSRDLIKLLSPGAVLFDISIDQGGCFETSRPCTHHEPVYIEEGIVHSAITNLPSAVSRTASISLSNSIARYVIDLALRNETKELHSGLNIKNKRFMIDF
jgi:alanine dehydrogenase